MDLNIEMKLDSHLVHNLEIISNLHTGERVSTASDQFEVRGDTYLTSFQRTWNREDHDRDFAKIQLVLENAMTEGLREHLEQIPEGLSHYLMTYRNYPEHCQRLIQLRDRIIRYLENDESVNMGGDARVGGNAGGEEKEGGKEETKSRHSIEIGIGEPLEMCHQACQTSPMQEHRINKLYHRGINGVLIQPLSGPPTPKVRPNRLAKFKELICYPCYNGSDLF